MGEKAIRIGAIGILGSRIAYGLALVVSSGEIVPDRLALAALLRDAPVRPLLAASIAGDLADIAATAISREGLPDGSAKATTAVAGPSPGSSSPPPAPQCRNPRRDLPMTNDSRGVKRNQQWQCRPPGH